MSICVTGCLKRAHAAGCTTSATHFSSASVIGQLSVAVDEIATDPSFSAATLSGWVMPQMPGPSMARAGCT